jgi:FkbM family methyltransferase
VADADVWQDGDRWRCDVVPSSPSAALARYLDACAADDELWALPAGQPIHALNGHELAYMAHEQLTADVYRLADLPGGATVVDVGANVGLFTLLAACAGPDRRVVAIEPVPALAALIGRSAWLHGLQDRISVRQHGVGRVAEEAAFAFAPFFGALSSRNQAERADISRRVVLAIRMLLPRMAEAHGVPVDAARERIAAELREQEVVVPVQPLSSALRDASVDRVDLLKVDVEGAELEVLEGLDDGDWPRVHRIAMEVNDVDGRLARITTLLEARGYETSVEDDASASRVVPRRIAIVHASRGPLGPRTGAALVLPDLTAATVEGEARPLADAVGAAVMDRAGAAPVVRTCAPTVCGARVGARDGTALLEPLAGAISELLGVPALRLAEGWPWRGFDRSAVVSEP